LNKEKHSKSRKEENATAKNAEKESKLYLCCDFGGHFSASISIQLLSLLVILCSAVDFLENFNNLMPHVLHFYEHFLFSDQTIQK
jgi:hypothetical protein